MSRLRRSLIFILMTSQFAGAANAQADLYTSYPQLYKMSFKPDYLRYSSVLGFFSELEKLIPIQNKESSAKECHEITELNVSVLGANDPSLAQPLESQPGVLYFNLYQKCVRLLIAENFSNLDQSFENGRIILSDTLNKKIGKSPWTQVRFSELSQDAQIQITVRMIEYIAGPEPILISKKYIGPENIFQQENLNSISHLSEFLALHLLKRNSNLSLAEMYESLILILRNGPILKS